MINKNMIFRYLIYSLTIFGFLSLKAHAQNLVCSSNGYQNVVRAGNNNDNTQRILILKISSPVMYAEFSGLIDKKMRQSSYKIVSESKESLSAYEIPTYEGAFSISTISVSIKENIVTTVTLNPYGASITLYNCNAR